MPFQPFGYHFDIKSTQSPGEVKAVLRAKKKRWFDVKNGPRGWIVGPFICLWLSALDRSGPMLIGSISRDSFGTRIRGRAGSDLNGLIMFSLLSLLMAFIVYKMISDGSATTRLLVIVAVVFLLGGPFTFWWAHKERRQAEPLVNFIRRSLGAPVSERPRPRAYPDPTDYPPMRLTVWVDQQEDMPATPADIREAVQNARNADDGFVILESGDQHFMQVAVKGDGFRLEKREGGDASHFEARHSDGGLFSPEEVAEALVGYLAGRADPPNISWKPLFFR